MINPAFPSLADPSGRQFQVLTSAEPPEYDPIATQAAYDTAQAASPAIPAQGPMSIRPVDFLLLFTSPERIAIRQARATDPIIDDFWSLLDATAKDGTISLDHPAVQQGIGYLGTSGKLTADRVARVQAGLPPL